MESELVKLLGPKLLKGGNPGHKINTSELQSVPKIALYYSAKWCVPCKQFTPKLIELYNEANKEEQILEIIFVSGDNDEEDFEEYYRPMPWLSLPFDDILDDVTAKLPVTSLPCLKVIDPSTGAVKVENAKDDVLSKGVDCIEDW